MVDVNAVAAEGSAPSTEVVQDQDQEQQAVEAAASADGNEQQDQGNISEPADQTTAPAAEKKDLGDKGVRELINTRKRAQKAEEETRRKAEEAAYWRGIAEGKGHKPVGAQQGQPIDEDPEPKPEQFENIGEYAKAVGAYSARQTLKEERANEAKRQQEQTARDVQAKRAETVTRVIEVGRDEFEDFDDVTDGRRLQLTPVMVAAILKDPDVAHKVEYHLGTNLEVARKINAMDPVDQVLEIDKIKKAIRAASQPKTASNAPPPLAKVTGNSAPPRSTLDPNLSTEERIAAFRQKRPEARR